MFVLFMTQRHDRIDLGRTTGRHPASQERHGTEQKTHCHKRERIGWTDTVEEIAQHLGQTEGRGQSKRRADCGELHPLPQYQSQHVAPVRAQCQANPNLARPTAHVLGERGIKTDGGEHDRQHSAEGYQSGRQPLLPERLIAQRAERSYAKQRKVRVKLGHDLPHRTEERGGIRLRANVQTNGQIGQTKIWLNLIPAFSAIAKARSRNSPTLSACGVKVSAIRRRNQKTWNNTRGQHPASHEEH